MADDFESEENPGFFARLKESPRTVSAIIIILIVAAAIYAFSGDETQAPDEFTDGDQVAVTDGESTGNVDEDEENENAPEENKDSGPTENNTTPPPAISQDQLNEEASSLPEPTRTEEGFMEVAEAGDGTTHLARRATTRWLSENQAGYEVTNEHRIFIEDYIQKQIGSEGLALGATHTISYELISEAVAAAGNLSNSQLNNLSQYTYVFST